MQPGQDINPNKKFVFTAIVLLFTAVSILLIYFLFVAYRSYSIYSSVKSNQRGWVGKVYQSDPELGFAPVPNSRGAQIYPIGDNINMRFDEHGFRIPLNDSGNSSNQHPKILFLGCSYTYGDSVLAEEAYPYLVGKLLGGVAINSGVCSYGLSQMLILAKKLVAKHKPDYLVVQYSQWLVGRAMNQFAPVFIGQLPVPYFYKNDGLKLHSPAFSPIIFDLPIDKFRNSPKSAIEFISFLQEVGLPMFFHDDFNIASLGIKKMFGIIPVPTSDALGIVKYTYGEISRIAMENHAKLVIVALDVGSKPLIPVPYSLFPQNAIIVDAHKAMLEKLPVVSDQDYRKEYMLWRGNPPVIADTHPNAKAHKIIAEAIVSKIQLSNPLVQ